MRTDVSEPTELVYPAASSWLPAVAAAGLAGLVTGLFTWWPYAVIGGFALLLALRAWFRSSTSEIARLPRRQRPVTATIPLQRSQPPE